MTVSEWKFIVAFMVVFLSVPVFNFVVDPYDLRSQDPVVLRSNPPETFTRAEQLLRFEASAAALDERVVILGTSHVGFGIDGCETGMAKFWLPGMNRAEVIRIVNQLAGPSVSDRLIIIDTAALARGPISEDFLPPFINSLLRPDTTVLSIRKLFGAPREPTSLACRAAPIPTPTGDLEMSEAWKTMFSQEVLEFESGIAEVAAACRNPNVRVAVVWFPFYFTLNTPQQMGSLGGYLDGSRTISIPTTKGGCSVTVINLASEAFQSQVEAGKLGTGDENWIDFNHFRPAAGRGYIDTVLKRVGGRSLN